MIENTSFMVALIIFRASKFSYIEGTQGRDEESYTKYGDLSDDRSSDAQDGQNQKPYMDQRSLF